MSPNIAYFVLFTHSLQNVRWSCWLQKRKRKKKVHRNLSDDLCVMTHVLVSLLYACRFATILLNKPLPQDPPCCTHWAEVYWPTCRVSCSLAAVRSTLCQYLLLKAPGRNVSMYFFNPSLIFSAWFKKVIVFGRSILLKTEKQSEWHGMFAAQNGKNMWLKKFQNKIPNDVMLKALLQVMH